MIYITGDTHGDFEHIEKACKKIGTTKEDVMIVLGDAGINYWGGASHGPDDKLKQYIRDLPISFFCIHGNHERRPETCVGYHLVSYRGGEAWVHDNFPSILFAKDGCVYDFNGYKCLVAGGAYSVDKDYRLRRGWHWFADEQPSEKIKSDVESKLRELDYKVDIVMTHTCPLRYEPVEVFLPFIDQDMVDKSTEAWLGKIENKLDYKVWYCGHFHTEKRIDKMRFMFHNIEELFSGTM